MASEDIPFEEIAAELGGSRHTVNSYVYGRR
jgi:DNA-binding CsgD family transcriptional regulator